MPNLIGLSFCMYCKAILCNYKGLGLSKLSTCRHNSRPNLVHRVVTHLVPIMWQPYFPQFFNFPSSLLYVVTHNALKMEKYCKKKTKLQFLFPQWAKSEKKVQFNHFVVGQIQRAPKNLHWIIGFLSIFPKKSSFWISQNPWSKFWKL